MKFFDVTLPLSPQSIVWPGDARFSRIEKKGTAIVSQITMSSHMGTHLDAPKHFIFSATSVDGVALSKLIGQAKIFALHDKPQISLAAVQRLAIKPGDKILFKTANQKLLRNKNFTSDYVSLSLDAAKFLAAKKIDLVGIDYFGIEAKSSPGHPVHKTLLRAGIVIVEGLDLSKVTPGVYQIAALPMKIKDGDGAPCRVVLWR